MRARNDVSLTVEEYAGINRMVIDMAIAPKLGPEQLHPAYTAVSRGSTMLHSCRNCTGLQLSSLLYTRFHTYTVLSPLQKKGRP